MDESLKTVWAYMLENGKLTSGSWSYYGGNWEGVSTNWDWRKDQEANKEFLDKVKKVGVDWDRTKHPDSDMQSAFTDSFHDSARVETLLGTIVLKDGSEYIVGVKNIDVRFGDYIKMVKQMMENQKRVKDIFGE